jgi:hypothetical protein
MSDPHHARQTEVTATEWTPSAPPRQLRTWVWFEQFQNIYDARDEVNRLIGQIERAGGTFTGVERHQNDDVGGTEVTLVYRAYDEVTV